MATISIRKNTVEVYKIRNKTSLGWADITIDDNGNAGRISIASDYGSWQHYWGACGVPFKTFLDQIGIDYAACKFKADEYFDMDGSINEMKEIIIDCRKRESISETYARELFDKVKEIEDEQPSQVMYVSLLSQAVDLLRFFDHSPPVRKIISPGFRRFWEEVWGPFMAHLTAEKIGKEMAQKSR